MYKEAPSRFCGRGGGRQLFARLLDPRSEIRLRTARSSDTHTTIYYTIPLGVYTGHGQARGTAYAQRPRAVSRRRARGACASQFGVTSASPNAWSGDSGWAKSSENVSSSSLPCTNTGWAVGAGPRLPLSTNWKLRSEANLARPWKGSSKESVVGFQLG
eukprot:scaffold6185_cov132-Isochrysis_galbana.AAC.4